MPWSDNGTLLLACGLTLAGALLTGATLLLSRQQGPYHPPRSRVAEITLLVGIGLILLLLRRFLTEDMFSGALAGLALLVMAQYVRHAVLQRVLPFLAAAVFAYTVFYAVGYKALGIALSLLAAALCVLLPKAWMAANTVRGVALTTAMIAFGMCALFAGSVWIPLAVCLAALCLGILPWTFPREIVRLGDTGAAVLGFFVAVMVVAVMVWMPTPDPGLAPVWLVVRNLALVSLPLMPLLVDVSVPVHGQPLSVSVAEHVGHTRVAAVQFLLSAAGLMLMLWLWPRDHAAVLWLAAAWLTLLIAVRILAVFGLRRRA